MNRSSAGVALSQGEFVLFHDLVLARTGMHFSSRRQGEMARHLRLVAEEEGFENLLQLYQRLAESRTDSPLWDRVISGLTVGETYFMRDSAQFAALRQHILPEIIRRRQKERRLRIWSAGCASGEEPYSLAMLLSELIPDWELWSVLILGTDINKQSLARARQGTYKKWSFRQCGPEVTRRYFNSQGQLFQIKPEAARRVSFAYLNLAEDTYPSLMTNTCAMDLILCRNVAIYLPEEQVRKMVKRFTGCLAQDGWLLVAATETDPRGFPGLATRAFDSVTAYQLQAPGDKAPAETALPVSCEPPAAAVAVYQAPRPLPAAPPARPQPKPTLPTGPELLAQARRMLERDQLQSARCLLEQVRRHGASTANLWLKGARRLANQGRLSEARHWCDQALQADPLLPEAHHCRALIALEEGEAELAGDHLRKALYLEPNHLAAHFSLATLYRRLGQNQKALLHGRQAIRLASSLPADQKVPEADGLSAGRIVTMLQVLLEAA
ncbi:MAG: hypothetical protein K9K66_04920 [Desulfarculaceae bacterium]|nr:hypothetical protein [Desulfarculaceae bacterium]MCF8072814.1 hypothetical protein [Desulfarculaceae bacterium]MCF8100982.1 hypothetical protein [Desulfarculaceae bacterium]MCF8118546.1 hypothetical protein [Desulfarculaceae bacterium]